MVRLLAMAMAGVITGGGVAAATAADVESGTATGRDETGGEIAPDSDGAVVETDLHMVVAQRMEINDSAVESQVRIDGLSAQAEATVAVYRNTNQRIEALRSYNHQLEEMTRYQDEELAGLRKEIDEVELIAREVMPLMLEMIEALENFVELDVPFLAEERAVRIADLRRLMVRADITDAERYRRIVEAYQIENEYGRTIEVYQGELELDGKSRLVEFLRVGRIALLYQTLDGTETGVWDHRNRAWKEAASSRSAVRKGIRVARKQTAPDLLRIPVPAAEAAK
jgi:tetratricopeptide (TPR) repeat protein